MRFALCALVLVTACSAKKKHDEAPPPAPGDAAAVAVVPADAPPPPPCITAVTLAPGGKLDLPALKATAATCPGVNVTAGDAMTYGELIGALDALVAQGFVNLSVGEHPRHDSAQLPPGTTRSAKTNEGLIIGRFEEKPAGEVPIVVITKDDVSVLGKIVGKPQDPGIADAIAAALPDATVTHTLILQAVKTTSLATVRSVVRAADGRGYTNLLFGLTDKKR